MRKVLTRFATPLFAVALLVGCGTDPVDEEVPDEQEEDMMEEEMDQEEPPNDETDSE